jgi:cobaltochelatase CobT
MTLRTLVAVVRLRNFFRSLNFQFMAASPICIGLKRRLGLTNSLSSDANYPIFTTEYDEVVNAADLSALLPTLSTEQQESFDNASLTFDKLFTAERAEIGATGAVLIRDIQDVVTAEERDRSVVSFLIDHSGSMRGLRMISALLAVEGTVDALQSAGIATETLGFTTTSWKGGLSRQAWRWAGKPANPGRLCDLRHIVYADADSTVRHPWHLRMALRSDLLHENIDGEALMWAAGRLNVERWTRRVICLVSDGVPIDDSTLLANEDQTLLTGHLEVVEQRLRKDGVVVGTLIIGRDYAREPAFFERASEPREAGLALMQLVRRALLPF